MPKRGSRFICQECGAVHPRWSGKCDACGAWNSIVEEAEAPVPGAGGRSLPKVGPLSPESLDGEAPPAPRRLTGNAEIDRVTGGGLVPGAAILIGGDPGIGKSTLLLQVLGQMSKDCPCLYVSGEEALDQIRMRASRLGMANAPLTIAAGTSVEQIVATLAGKDPPAVVVIDSSQTLHTSLIESAPGTVAQLRAATQALLQIAKPKGITILLVGHVTKDGQIAGPRVLEHMVDAVLYFEGDRSHQFRILRAVKNRFGATDEIGVFEMRDSGLAEVGNPSKLFLADRQRPAPGTAVFAGMEGTRPLLVEFQALVAPAPPGSARRAVVGWDSARLAMILAVLEARAGVRLGGHDVYLNVAGGLRVMEPAADLAAAAALVSALSGDPLPLEAVAFGEIALTGEVRPVAQAEARLREAGKLGFTQAILPAGGEAKLGSGIGLSLNRLHHIAELPGSLRQEAAA